jgi:DedD protein
MNDKNELLHSINNNDDNMKKYLIIGGLVFVLFVVGIVVAKFLFSSNKEATKVILPPETTTNTKVQKSDTELFSSIPVEDNKDNINNNEDTFKKPVVNQKINSVVSNKVEEPIKDTKVKIEKKPVYEAKPVVKEVVKKKKELKNNFSNLNKNYYIQVAALTRGEPSKNFLKLIIKNGFEYKIVNITINNKHIKRVLIGPFSKNEAKKALPIIKEKITSSAFIKKLK